MKKTIGLLKFINGSFQLIKVKDHESETISHNLNLWKADKDQEYWVEIVSADLVTNIKEDGPYLKGILK